MVLSRDTPQADRDGTVATGPNGSAGVLLSRLGSRALRPAKASRFVRAVVGSTPWRVGWLSHFCCCGSLLHSRVSLGKAPYSVASPEPSHRHLRFYWRDPGRAAGSHGIDHALRIGRAI